MQKQKKERKMPFVDPTAPADKLKLTKKEIENAAKIFKSFVDPANKVKLVSIIQHKCQQETWWAFHKLVCYDYDTPAYNDYNVDKYIKDKGLISS